MKRAFSSVLVLLVLLALTTTTVFAGSALQLVKVQNNGAGPTFTFQVTGEFSEAELNGGFVQVEGGDAYPLYCVQQDATTVVCHTSKKVGGQNVVVGFGGSRFWTEMPEQYNRTYCYSAWDYWDFTGYQWTDFGPICQDEPAHEGQEAFYDYPQEDIYGAWVVFFEDVTGACGGTVPAGPAYYYPFCP